jgi:hypothetical protein
MFEMQGDLFELGGINSEYALELPEFLVELR